MAQRQSVDLEWIGRSLDSLQHALDSHSQRMSEESQEFAEHAGVAVIHATEPQLEPHPETTHTEHGLTYLASGWLRIEHGTEIVARPGSITVVPAGVPHRAIDGRDLEYWLVSFCAPCVKLDESQILMSAFRNVRHGALPIITVPRSRRRALVRLFRDLRAECLRAAPESPDVIRSLLLLILADVHRALPHAGDGYENSFVSDALQFIQRRCLDSISLKDVAAAVHRTPAHVAATIKKSTGYSVGAWINSGRVGEAANRLVHTDDSLDDVAASVGWQDKTHFIRQFRKAYGVTPAAWRRQQRRAHDTSRHNR